MGFLSCYKHLSTVQQIEVCQIIETRICALHDDLLLRILIYVPPKDAVATSVLSKRWRFVWTMLPRLEFKDDGSESFGWFIQKSLQLHKAPKLASLIVELGPNCPVDVDVGKWVEKAVDQGVKELDFKLLWTAEPISFPKCLYTCDTLVDLTLSNQILVHVSSPVRLPSLLHLSLLYVVYKDEDSFVRLLSSSSVLKSLIVHQHEDANLKKITVKVSSLKTLQYKTRRKDEVVEDEVDEVEEDEVDEVDENEVEDDGLDEIEEDEVEDDDVYEIEEDELEEDEVEDDDDLNGSLVIDSPALINLDLVDVWGYCLIENMSSLNMAHIGYVGNPDDKFLRSLSSAKHLYLLLTKSMVAWCNSIKFSRLIELYFHPNYSIDWLEPFMFLLQNSPKVKTLTIHTESGWLPVPAASWNQPSSTPECLSSHLEIFRWGGYGGREYEKQLMTYILANSKYLKTVEISFLATCNLEERQKELISIPRISTSSQLLISTQMEWRFFGATLVKNV